MRITNLVLSCLLLASIAVLAQSMPGRAPAAGQHPPSASHVDNAGPIIVLGCLSGGRDAYTLAQSGTGTMFKLQGGSQFEQFRGKQVEVTARELPPVKRTGLNDLPVLTVNQVRVIGDLCPFSESTGAPAATPTGIPQTQNAPSRNTSSGAAAPRYGSPGAPNQTPPNIGTNPNVQGANGAPSPGTGNPPPPSPPPSPPRR